MKAERKTPEIWFERSSLTIGWLSSYWPINNKGLSVMITHMAVVLVWTAPFALLGQFSLISDRTVVIFVFPVAVGGLVSLMRTAHRHSVPRE